LVRITPVSGSASSNALRGVGRVLAGHGVDHEQGLDRLASRRARARISSIMSRVDMQSPGGVDDQDVLEVLAGRIQRRLRDLDRLLVRALDGNHSTPTSAARS
jgi:hypothetical protein